MWNYMSYYSTPWGIKTASCTLGQLASIDIPNESDIEYDQMMIKAIFSFYQMLWWSMTNQNYQINGFNTGFMLPLIIQASDVPEGEGDYEMNNICSNNMINTPPQWYYWTYQYMIDKKGRNISTYTMYDYSIGIEPTSRGYDQPIPNLDAQYLFIDTIPEIVININGLFNRFFVFNNFGLKKN